VSLEDGQEGGLLCGGRGRVTRVNDDGKRC